MRERVKELSCLYRVAAAFNELRGSLGACLARVAAVLPEACRYPELAAARVRVDSLEECSTGFRDSPDSLRCEIRVAGRARGTITLTYADAPVSGADAFLAEEKTLIETIAQQVGVFVAGIESERQRVDIEAQLRHADRLASIGQLAAGVAHELNEPLGGVLGFAQLALREPDVPEQVRADLNRIVEASLHSREIIRKLLVFARQAPASKQPVNVNAVVEESMFLLEAGCENPGIRFERRLAPGLPDIEADAVQIRQVVTNLVINAIQAIEGPGTITVRTGTDSGGVVIVVEDTGSGMSPEVERHIFDPFFTTKDVGRGTGLGLSVVQGIVVGHGGTVEVESEPARGSRFRVRLRMMLNTGKDVCGED